MWSLDLLVSLLAPHDCVQCGAEGALLCTRCSAKLTPPTTLPHLNGVDAVGIASEYQGGAKQVVHALKFERAKAAAEDIASVMSKLCDIPNDAVLVPIPTTTSHIRMRGYDQVLLITRHLSRTTRLPYTRVLHRQGQRRQVGASRQQRRAQLGGVFSCTQQLNPNLLYVLIDDVLTTGATIEHAAAVLRRAGAGHVSAAVFAYQALK